MEASTNDFECEILHNLNDIDKICSKPDLTAKDVSILYEKFIDTMTWIDDNLKSIESKIAVQLIEFLKHFFDVR